MSDTVIDQVNRLGKDQPEHLTSRDRKVRLIGEIKLTVVDEESTETSQKIKWFRRLNSTNQIMLINNWHINHPTKTNIRKLTLGTIPKQSC